MKRMLMTITVLLVVLAAAGSGAVLWFRSMTHGFSARSSPTRVETMLAEYARAAAMPASARMMRNPISFTPAVEQESLAHYADHCAICHANNGSGDTMFGKGLYPKPPDLRAAYTQHRSDGELFSILENGIRMSGMPAFGGPDSADASWKLVHFIRHLPKLTPAEEEEMERLNPKGPDEWKEEQDEEQFLKGDSSSPATATNQHLNHTNHHPKGRPQ